MEGTTPEEIFSIMMDDETHSWYQGLMDNQDLRTEFLQEFGEEEDKVWHKKKSFKELKQGSLTGCKFVCQVLPNTRRVFGLGTYVKIEDTHKNEIIVVLKNGFNNRTKIMILTCKAKTLDEIIQVEHDAKCLEEQPSTDNVLVVEENKWKELVLPALDQ